jgi:hypothetical protein
MDAEVVVSKDKREDRRYHKPRCKRVAGMKPSNRQRTLRSTALAKGYKRCGDCMS